MKNPWPLGFAAAVLLVALTWWLVHDARERSTTEASSILTATPGESKTPAPRTAAMTGAARIPAAMKVGVAASADAATPDWSKRLQESEDFWAFAESAIGPAKRGDGDARYWLALALNDCRFVYPMFFTESLPGKPPRRLTLDEARQHAAGMQGSTYSADDMDLLEKRCSRLSEARDSPFGDGNKWMDAALAVDNPLAQAGAAGMKSIASLHMTDPEKAREARAEVRRLIVEAARTGNPEAMIRISGAAANLMEEDASESKVRELSWMLAACLRTPDCDGLTQWRKMRCNWDSQCQTWETPRDILRRDAGSYIEEVERRARELNEKIDAGTLEESDI